MPLKRYFTPFRCATYLLLLYCAAHTAGGMLAQASLGAEADAVFAQMKSVSFDFNGAASTWYGFWFGFGMMVSVFLVLSAVIAWQLDNVPVDSWRAVSGMAWALAVAHAVTALLSWKYFFMGPTVFGIAITLLMAVGTYRKGARAAAARAAMGG
ncbi:hypothetical protein D7X55_10175 [Corallococcus sp. AB049A]|uniref:LIC_13387 family protein n=1 Tax=Corallococcus sp. AB049A TaxID=2316721 RepID=UPI000EA3AFEF|nr:hypothetical protein [Corallococcus sp. AB049A]RKH54244.1 hypothetical protein D7Y23_01060 [Corallococcus sp. AB050B]RKI70344.1 hypothetical protein D7X55_10175 [Corallococcus sp. AB049A]